MGLWDRAFLFQQASFSQLLIGSVVDDEFVITR